jgi:Uma2 family endonuclease
MPASQIQLLTLAEFLKQPYIEDSPAWEYMDGDISQKPMPKTRHSILQKRLLAKIDAGSTDYTALPEVRCTFAGRSIVPDIAVVAWDRIPINERGEPEDNFMEAPDWAIEILSPNQQATRVIDNLLHCLRYGTKLGWLIDPDDYAVLIFAPQQEPVIFRGNSQLLLIDGVNLTLTAAEIFAWLQIGNR